ncbi:hypothetical protein HK103_006754 [Boothiomyces macroporosus]|uniref:Uncharacterized protein n=1 Tax=Boothiomyces macroporosus TaxID=261099 RepID=A0AAD5UH99_9FUNG|nr:hypothetical protein HK103_006754 [Boothiomyces macroporosus]
MKAIKFYNNQEYYKAREIIESNMVDGFELLSVYVKTMAELKDSSVIDYLESSSLQRDQVEQLIRQYELYCNAVIEEFDDLEEETIDGPQEPKKELIEQEETTSKPTDQESNHMDGEMSSVNNTPVNQPEKHLDNKKAPIYPKVILEFIRDLGVPIGIILSLIFYFLNRNTNGRLGRLISQFEQRVKNTFKMAIAK